MHNGTFFFSAVVNGRQLTLNWESLLSEILDLQINYMGNTVMHVHTRDQAVVQLNVWWCHWAPCQNLNPICMQHLTQKSHQSVSQYFTIKIRVGSVLFSSFKKTTVRLSSQPAEMILTLRSFRLWSRHIKTHLHGKILPAIKVTHSNMEQHQIRRPSEIITSGLVLHFLVIGKWITCSEVGWLKKKSSDIPSLILSFILNVTCERASSEEKWTGVLMTQLAAL